MSTPNINRIIEQVYDDTIGTNTLKNNLDMYIDEAISESIKVYLRMILDDELENFGNEILEEFGIIETNPALAKQLIQNKLVKLVASKIKPEIILTNLAFSNLKESYSTNNNSPKLQVLLG